MWFLWLILVICLIILISVSNSKSNKPSQSDRYAQGYWDGYRALGAKVREAMSGSDFSRNQLNDLINAGHGSVIAQTSVRPATSRAIEMAPAARYVPLPSIAVTTEQLAIQKQKTSISNLNMILYMASFLLVGAAAAFVAAAMPPAIRLIGLWSIVVLFYASGYILYKSVPSLRPAATAFLGTGLAILPFAGIALSMLGGVSGSWTWAITSAVGLVAYTAAAVLLQSQVVSYLTMAFVLSLASSVAATAEAPFVWYFVILIGVSLLANVVIFLKPTWLPRLFDVPIESTGQLVTPLALIASLFLSDQMTAGTYEVVFGLATAHYLVVWLQQHTVLYETIVRLLGHVTLLIVAWDVAGHDYQVFGIWWLGLASLQAGYSLVRVQPGVGLKITRETAWLASLTVLLAAGMVFWQSQPDAAIWTLLSLVVIGLVSLTTTLRLRDARWAVVGLGLSVAISFLIARWLVQPVWPWQTLATWFVLLAGASLGTYYYACRYRSQLVQVLFVAAFVAYGLSAIGSALASGDVIAIGWTFAGLAGLTVGLSYASRVVPVESVAGLLAFVAVAAWLTDSSIDGRWYLTALAMVSAGVSYAVSLTHNFLGQVSRRNQLLIIGQIYLGILALNVLGGDAVVIKAGFIVILAAALVSFGLRVASRQKSPTVQTTFMLSYFFYLSLAWLLSFQLEAGWSTLVYLAAALLFWLSSYIELAPGLVVVGNIALTAAVATLWNWLNLNPDWQLFGVTWIVAAILYGIYWLCVFQADVWRQWVCLGSIWVLLAVAFLFQSDSTTSQQIAAATNVIVTAGTLAVQGYLSNRKAMIEAGIYVATFGVQRIVGISIPEANLAFYGHWWAIVIALVAWWRGDGVIRRLIIAMAFVTVGTGLLALSEGGVYQLIFLIEHLALLVVGALLSKSWAIWWGISASALAVMYFLKDYLFLWLGFLGLLLIGIVVWRLVRLSAKQTT